MPQSRLAVTPQFLREILHLPADVVIRDAGYDEARDWIDLVVEGMSVPEAERITAHYEKQYESISVELKPWPGEF